MIGLQGYIFIGRDFLLFLLRFNIAALLFWVSSLACPLKSDVDRTYLLSDGSSGCRCGCSYPVYDRGEIRVLFLDYSWIRILWNALCEKLGFDLAPGEFLTVAHVPLLL